MPVVKDHEETVKGIPVFYGKKDDPQIVQKYQSWKAVVMNELEGVDVATGGGTKHLLELYNNYCADPSSVSDRAKNSSEARKLKAVLFKTMRCACVRGSTDHLFRLIKTIDGEYGPAAKKPAGTRTASLQRLLDPSQRQRSDETKC